MQNQESWWNRENWKRKWRWNKNAGNKDVYSVNAFITQMYAGTVCSQRKSLESWLLRSWTRRMNLAFWADPNFDNCLLLLILVCFWLWLQTHFVFSPFRANFCSATDMWILVGNLSMHIRSRLQSTGCFPDLPLSSLCKPLQTPEAIQVYERKLTFKIS